MKKNTEISERIIKVIDYLEVNKNEFAQKLGYERSQTIYDIINGKSAPSFDFFNRFFNSEYSEKINPNWLITGKGLFTTKNNTSNILNEPSESYGSKGKPFYNLPVSAGKSSYYNNGAIQPDGYIKDIPGISETDAFLPVHGYSMQPEVKEGSIIGVKKIDQWDTLNTQRKYLIITQDDRMIKYIQPDETNPEIIWCISPNYPRFKIYKSQIIEIHRVTFVINAE